MSSHEAAFALLGATTQSPVTQTDRGLPERALRNEVRTSSLQYSIDTVFGSKFAGWPQEQGLLIYYAEHGTSKNIIE